MRLLAVFLLAGWAASAQTEEHVHWQLESVKSAAPGSKLLARLTATIDSGWHLYSPTTPPGPIATTIRLKEDSTRYDHVRVFEPPPLRRFDPNFNAQTETYEGSAVFYLEVTLARLAPEGRFELVAMPRYQVCSGTLCIPPVRRTASTWVKVDRKAAASDLVIPAGYSEVKLTARPNAAAPASADSPWIFLLTAFGFGLAAIFTPCVFPMIPITMSYFLNQQTAGTGSRAAGLKQAVLFCVGIIVLFSALGLVTTSLLGPFGVVQLGSNPWVNGLIALIFVVFGLSLLGAYEITLPSFLLTRLDSASRGGGTVGTLLMGLTFSLASFACVGPFVGTLLAASVTSGGWRPLGGMAMFATGLALPFFLLAIFPSYLKKLPRSGGWLARVKVVMGFVILAAALKYMASIDQVLRWNVLTRERFLAAWIVLFAMAGLYLLGYVRLEGISKDEPLGLSRLFAGMIFVIFAVTLVPGMFGGRLGELEGFVPPPTPGATLGSASSGEGALVWMENDFPGAVAKARAEGKRLLVNFTGYACTNCHWMKQNLFTRPEIGAQLHNMVLVDLYTDGEDAASQANQQLEQSRFHTIAIPYYLVYDPGPAESEPRVIAEFPGLTRDAQQYLAFLNTASPVPAAAPQAALAKGADAATPGTAPDLPGLKTLEGAAYNAGMLTGKVAVVNFWATWCVPCRAEIPGLNQLQSTLGARGLQVIGVSIDEDGAEAINPFLLNYPMHYPVALAGNEAKNAYKLDVIPVTVIFDRTGQIVDRFQGLTDMQKIRAAVENVL